MGVIVSFQKKSNLATDKQIYQFPNKPSPSLSDLMLLSDEESAHVTKNCTFQQAANTILSVLPSGIYTPSFTILSGALDVILSSAMYFGSSISPNSIIMGFAKFKVEVSGDPVGINISMPVTSNFNDPTQITGMSGTVHLLDEFGNPVGGQAEGELISFTSNASTDGGDLYFTTSAESGSFLVTLNWAYQIQAALRKK